MPPHQVLCSVSGTPAWSRCAESHSPLLELLYLFCSVSSSQQRSPNKRTISQASATCQHLSSAASAMGTTTHVIMLIHHNSLSYCAADAGPSGSALPPNPPSGATSTADDLEGLFTPAPVTSQAAPQGPVSQLWPPTSPAQGRDRLSSPQAGTGMQGGFSQPGLGMQAGMGIQPGASMGHMSGKLSL